MPDFGGGSKEAIELPVFGVAEQEPDIIDEPLMVVKEEVEEEDPDIVSARNKSNTVKVLALVNFLIGCSISQLSPFYPLRAK